MIFAALLTASALAAAETPVVADLPHFRKAAVVDVARPCCGSGIFAFFATIRLSTLEEGEVSVHMTYGGATQALPKPGDICDVWLTTPIFGGMAPDFSSLRPPFYNAGRLQCGADSYS